MTAVQICSFVDVCGAVSSPKHDEWEVSFPPIPKPPVTEVIPVEVCSLLSSNCTLDRVYVIPSFLSTMNFLPHEPQVDGRAFKVLQISDTHLDPNYREGMRATCNDVLCCRESSGEPKSPGNRAGPWGDYRKCDTPVRLLDNLLEHISSTHRV